MLGDVALRTPGAGLQQPPIFIPAFNDINTGLRAPGRIEPFRISSMRPLEREPLSNPGTPVNSFFRDYSVGLLLSVLFILGLLILAHYG